MPFREEVIDGKRTLFYVTPGKQHELSVTLRKGESLEAGIRAIGNTIKMMKRNNTYRG